MSKNKNTEVKPLSLGEIDIMLARLQATRASMVQTANHQGLLLAEPAKAPVNTGVIAWPVSGMTKGQTFRYERKNGVREYTVLSVDKHGKPLTWTRRKV